MIPTIIKKPDIKLQTQYTSSKSLFYNNKIHSVYKVSELLFLSHIPIESLYFERIKF